MVEIITPRLRLRPARPSDLAAFHAVLSDGRAMAYWSSAPHGDLDQTRVWLSSMVSIPPGQGEDFAVEFKGCVVGKAGLYRFPEIGFILHPQVWGQGLAQEALAPVIDRAFAVHGLAAITADVDPRNAASLKLLARFGFTETGRARRTWRIADQWCDSVYLALSRSDREARGGSPVARA